MAKKVNPIMYIVGGFLLVLLIFGIIAVVLYPTPQVVEPTVELNDTVTVEYVGTFDNGTKFDEGVITDYTVGSHKMIRGFENALLGMKEGETKTVRVAPEDAYPYNESLVITYNRADVVEMLGSVPEVGAQVQSGSVPGVVTVVNETIVVVDFNRPLVTDQYLNFEITVLNIKSDHSVAHE
ncbi:Trigger factor [Methanosarcinaceae archaeon Ag5]|uniref:Peptidyl-prolyl cis-trans isomerase n=1 Tax=Methanolapillus africanus TaxID=3028297 RepID=A0AAE4SD62_9EURY|nr:Trigger factor [Methanosarcinaceae archaeon Ag5]